jgi:hypothetical protein
VKPAMHIFIIFAFLACTTQKESHVPKNETPTPLEATGVTPAPPAAPWTPPKTEPGADGWERYVDVPTLTPATAAGFTPGFDTPEGALLSFYASRMRGDDAWRSALADEKNPAFGPGDLARLNRKLDNSRDWKYLEVRLVGKKSKDEELWIKIHMKIEIGGQIDGGEDEATLVSVGGRWYVLSIPT